MPSRRRNGFILSIAMIGLFLLPVLTSYAETTNYIYDELNRLRRVEYEDGTNNEYVYDLTGNRIEVKRAITGLDAPTNLSSTAVSSTQVNLSWTDNSTAETGFKIERKIGTGGTYSPLDTVGANITAYSDSNLTPGTRYFYRVKAYNTNGDSAYSNEVAASYAITATAGSNGSISPSGEVVVFAGGSQAFTITPATGYLIGNVTVDGTTMGVVGTYTFTNVRSDHTIGATFAAPTAVPGMATLNSPTGTIATVTPTYTWNAVSEATWYYLWVSNPVGNPVIMQWYTAAQCGCSSGTGTCSITPTTALNPAATAQWWIQTNNSLGNGPWSNPLPFTISLPPPGEATLVSPDGTITTATPVYTWNAVAQSTRYYLRVKDPSSDNKILQWYTAAQANCASGTGTCSVTPTTGLTAGACQWWIQTDNNGAGNGPWSPAMQFNVDLPVPPVAPTLISPSGAINTFTPTYTWNALSNAADYYLWVSDGVGPRIQIWYTAAQAGCASGTGTCSVTPTTALTGGSFQWWIKGRNGSGEGPWSSAMSFSIPAPIAATLISPSGTISTNTPAYTWNAVPLSTSYYLWVSNPVGNPRITQWYTAVQCGCASGTGTCSITPSTALNSGQAQWWIQTNNSSGAANGPWSDPLAFTVP